VLSGDNPHVFAFRRVRGASSVTVIANLSAQPQVFEGVALAPWGYQIS
jgi:hypothetical protein